MSVTIERAAQCEGRPITIDLYRKEGVVSRVSLVSDTVWVKVEGEAEEYACEPSKVTWVDTIPSEFVEAVVDSENYQENDVKDANGGSIWFIGYPEADGIGSVSNAGLGLRYNTDSGLFIVAYSSQRILPLEADYLPTPWWLLELEERCGFVKP